MAGGRGGKVPPLPPPPRRDEAEVALEGGAGAAPRGSGERLTRATARSAAGFPAVAPGRSAAVAPGRSAAGAARRSAVATGRSAAGAAGLAAVDPSRGPRRRSPWRSTARAADLASVSPPRAHPTALPSAGPRCSRPLLPRGKAKPIPSATTTISSLSDDDLREIFLRLPNLRALVRAALTCRAVRSSRPFRRLFLALHPAPLIGLFIPMDQYATPSFLPLRRHSDPDVSAALRGGDFFLTSLPLHDDQPGPEGWSVRDSQDGYLILSRWSWHLHSIAAVNPVTRAADIIPSPLRPFCQFLPVLLCSDEHPRSFRVVCICLDKDETRWIRAAVFSSETSGWVVHPWVHVSGDGSLNFTHGTRVNGSVYWPVDREHRMVRAGDTKDGQLCILYEFDFVLHVWIRGVDRDGIEIWVPRNIIDLTQGMGPLTQWTSSDLEGDLEVLEVRSGYVYYTFCCWFFSLSLETLVHELLLSCKPSCKLSESIDDGRAHLYFMAWPRSLVGDDGSTGNEVESSH